MPTVFYWTTQGAPGARPIYGLHPSGRPVKGGVPAGVASFEVDAPQPGCEQSCVVDDRATPVLVPNSARLDDEADRIFDRKAVKALALALGGDADEATLRGRFRSAWKAL